MNSDTLTLLKIKIGTTVLLGLLTVPASLFADGGRSYGDSAYYPRLDAWPNTQYEFGLTVVPTTKLEHDIGDTTQMELDAQWLIYKSDEFFLGTVQMGVVFDLVTFGDSTRISLPGQLLNLGADITGTWRYTGDYALQFGMRPGLFSELDAISTDGLYIPFSGYFLKRLGPDLSGIVGVEIRPNFELGIMPTIGLDWDISDTMLLRFGVPESRLDVALNDEFDMFFKIEWENTSYKMEEGGFFPRDTMTLEDLAISGGATVELSSGLEIGGELGARIGRGIEFEVFGPEGVDDIDVDNAFFTRFFARRTF